MSAPIEHPSWCRTDGCGVRVRNGVPTGTHASRVVVIDEGGSRLRVELSLWQVHGREPFVSIDWNRPDDVPVDGILFDLVDAGNVARVIRDLVRLAEREAAS